MCIAMTAAHQAHSGQTKLDAHVAKICAYCYGCKCEAPTSRAKCIEGIVNRCRDNTLGLLHSRNFLVDLSEWWSGRMWVSLGPIP